MVVKYCNCTFLRGIGVDYALEIKYNINILSKSVK